jgi:hypothetical protein
MDKHHYRCAGSGCKLLSQNWRPGQQREPNGKDRALATVAIENETGAATKRWSQWSENSSGKNERSRQRKPQHAPLALGPEKNQHRHAVGKLANRRAVGRWIPDGVKPELKDHPLMCS